MSEIRKEELRRRANLVKMFDEQTEREEKEAQQQKAAQQQQAAAQQQQQQYENDTKYTQVQGAPTLGMFSKFFGGRKKYNKSPRRKNKTRKSRKTQRKVHRLYKSRNRRR